MTSHADMKTSICEVMERDHVSFAELARIEGFEGDLSMAIKDNPNIVYWINISDTAMDCIDELLKEGHCHLHPAPWIVYLCDGASLPFPLVKRNYKYKTPHWMPVTFKLGAKCKQKNCPKRRLK